MLCYGTLFYFRNICHFSINLYNAGKINFLPYPPHFRSQPKDIAKRQCFGILIAAANLYGYDSIKDFGMW